ncbi:MAG: hypothetical protein AB7F98_14245 [Novosphingobium sp.]
MRYTLAVLIVPVLLAGCNFLYSESPWFTPADAEGAPRLRDGLWAVLDNAECTFDDKLPANEWPGCAGAMVVEGDSMSTLEWLSDEEGVRNPHPSIDTADVVLAAGNPRIIQYQATGKSGNSDRKPEDQYFYAGMRPTAHDAQGRITAFNRWIVLCGPLPPPGKPDVTERPFKGLTIRGTECTANSVAALRNAAKRSERIPDRAGQIETPPARWVREGRS